MADEVQPTVGTNVGDPAAGAAYPPVSYVLLDDPALVEAARYAPDAFAVLYERHVRSVFAFCYSKMGDAPQAEDITSQTFLRALRALPQYEQRGIPFKSWLYRIAANLIIDSRRARRPEQPLETAPPGHDDATAFEPADPAGEAGIAAWEQAEDFKQLIAGLKPEQRTVVRLRFEEGLPLATIAVQVGRTEGAVKMLLMRALQNLRRDLDREAAHGG